jgi:hypothetical protein
MSHRLSPEQVATYRREGFLIHDAPVFAPDEFARLKTHFEGLLAALPPGERPEAMDVPHFGHPALFEWLFADAVLDLVEPLIGPDIALWSSHFIAKPKGDGRRVPWHEDSYYWRGRLDPMEVVTVWLAIDPSTPENGAMYVIPRTHGNGYSDYEPVDLTENVFDEEIKKSQRDESRAVACVLAPNQASLHDAKLMHGSPPNHSAQRRCGYTMRYIPTHVRVRPDDDHQIYLARGRDRAGNRYADPDKAYPDLARRRRGLGRSGH